MGYDPTPPTASQKTLLLLIFDFIFCIQHHLLKCSDVIRAIINYVNRLNIWNSFNKFKSKSWIVKFLFFQSRSFMPYLILLHMCDKKLPIHRNRVSSRGSKEENTTHPHTHTHTSPPPYLYCYCYKHFCVVIFFHKIYLENECLFFFLFYQSCISYHI